MFFYTFCRCIMQLVCILMGRLLTELIFFANLILGLGTSFFPFLNIGACIEFRTGSFSARWVWDRFREGGITIFSGVPTVFLRLMWHYQQEISQLPQQEVDAYKKGANDLRALLCGSSALQSQVQDFWTNIRNGRPIFVRYGSSEIPA